MRARPDTHQPNAIDTSSGTIRRDNEAIPGPYGFTYIDYPQLEGFDNEYLEQRINRVIYRETVKVIERELEEEQIEQDRYSRQYPEDSTEWGKFYTDEVTFEVTHQSEHLLSILITRFIDSGGAHPNHDTRALTVDLDSGYRYSLWDLFRSDKNYKRTLKLLLQSNQISYTQGEFFDLPEDEKGAAPEKDLPEDFDFFIKDGYLVVFNLFSAYVNQAVWARISFTEIHYLLHPEGPVYRFLNKLPGV